MARLRPVSTPLSQRLSDFQRGPLTLVVWVLAVLSAVWLIPRQTRPGQYIGFARSFQYEVSSTSGGLVDELFVELFDDVDSGQIVARLKASEVEARIRTAAAEIDRLSAELDAASHRLQAELLEADASGLAELRRFWIDEEQLHLDSLALRTTIESDRIELERLALRTQRLEGLTGSGVTSEEDLEDAQLRQAAQAKAIELSEQRLAEMEQQYRSVQTRRRSFADRAELDAAADVLSRPLAEAIEVQRLRIEEIRIEREGLTLRAPVTGRVASVTAGVGQGVLPGEPLLTIMDGGAKEILAFLPADVPNELESGSRVLVSSREDPQVRAESIVVCLGPAIEEIPRRLWRDPALPEYGRPFLLVAVSGLDLTPGEIVDVKVLR